MNLSLNEDQAALMTAVEGLSREFRQMPMEFRGFSLCSAKLEQRLSEAQFFDIAQTPGLGSVAAAMTVERLAQLPYAAEAALSLLVRPRLLGGGLPRPVALVERGRPGRFVASAGTLIIADGDALELAQPSASDTEPVESIYAYPMGRLCRSVQATVLASEAAGEARTWLRIALSAEAAGLMQAALDATVEHVTVRTQFGRPLGTFQALRHRLAECAVLVGGVKLLALQAACTASEGDAALAAFHAQHSARRVVYDLHQMLGAMGMTLEHPLHLWTYRLKFLLSELGGAGAQARAVVEHCFDPF